MCHEATQLNRVPRVWHFEPVQIARTEDLKCGIISARSNQYAWTRDNPGHLSRLAHA